MLSSAAVDRAPRKATQNILSTGHGAYEVTLRSILFAFHFLFKNKHLTQPCRSV